MSSTAVTGIGQLVTCDGTGTDLLGIRSNAALVVEDGMTVDRLSGRCPLRRPDRHRAAALSPASSIRTAT